MKMEYNTTEERLRLPQYGRLVQEMIDRAERLKSKPARQAYAGHIVEVMTLLNPQLCNTPNYEQTFWNHLAYMSGYTLDIDYPCPIEHNTKSSAPHKLAYPGNKIRFRHYGHILESLLAELRKMPANAPGRDAFIRMVALRMKRYLADWKGDGIEDEKVGRDVAMYTDGAVTADEVIRQLETAGRRPRPQFSRPRYGNGRRRQ